MTIVIHAFPISPRGFKVVLAAEHLGVDYRLKLLDMAAGDQRTLEFTELNPNQRMPVLVDGSYVLWESSAIVEYLGHKAGNTDFLPADPGQRLQMAKWLYWDSAHWDPAIAILMYERLAKKLMNIGEPNQAEIDRGTQMLLRLAPILDGQLARHAFVAGDTVTAADIALASPLTYAEPAELPLADFTNIRRWKTTMEALPGWQRAAELQRSLLPPSFATAA